jgi:hypothetical protein
MSGIVIHSRYPASSVVLYNGTTVVHFGLATAGLVVVFSRWPLVGWLLGGVYCVFAFAQMYLVMPLAVCPHCAYRTMSAARCVSGLNLLSGRFSRVRSPEEFGRRGEGALCHNNLYMAALVAPLALVLAGLLFNYSLAGLVVLLVLAGMMAFRYFILFKRIACPHCAARGRCPNAKAMGIG